MFPHILYYSRQAYLVNKSISLVKILSIQELCVTDEECVASDISGKKTL